MPDTKNDQRSGHNIRYSKHNIPIKIVCEELNIKNQYVFNNGGSERGHLTQLLLSEIPQNVLRSGTILDYGCGLGNLSIFLICSGANNVFAIDISDVAIEKFIEIIYANNLSYKIKAKRCSVTNIPFPDNTFDVVVGQAILHHIYGLENVENELHRILKPGGKVIFTDSLSDSLFMRIPRIITMWRFNKKYPDQGEQHMYRKKIHEFGRLFKTTTIREHSMIFMIKRFFRGHHNKDWVKSVLRIAHLVDLKVLTIFPFMRRFCGEAVIIYEK